MVFKISFRQFPQLKLKTKIKAAMEAKRRVTIREISMRFDFSNSTVSKRNYFPNNYSRYDEKKEISIFPIKNEFEEF